MNNSIVSPGTARINGDDLIITMNFAFDVHYGANSEMHASSIAAQATIPTPDTDGWFLLFFVPADKVMSPFSVIYWKRGDKVDPFFTVFSKGTEVRNRASLDFSPIKGKFQSVHAFQHHAPADNYPNEICHELDYQTKNNHDLVLLEETTEMSVYFNDQHPLALYFVKEGEVISNGKRFVAIWDHSGKFNLMNDATGNYSYMYAEVDTTGKLINTAIL